MAMVNSGLQTYIVYSRMTDPVLARGELLRLGAETMAAVYFAAICICYVRIRTVTLHSRLTTHICANALFVFIHWYLYTFGNSLSLHSISIPRMEEYAAFSTSALLMLASSAVPLGPQVHQDLTRVYTKAVIAKVKEAEQTGELICNNSFEPNVNPEVSACIFSHLTFHFVYPLISKVSKMEQADIQDLPAAQACFRTQNIIHDSFQVNSNNGLRSSYGPTLALLYTIWAPEWLSVVKGVSHVVAADGAHASVLLYAAPMPALVPATHLSATDSSCPRQLPR